MAVELHIIAKPKLKHPTLVEGFPGLGLVGTISASYLIEKLKMEPLGYITSDQFPPLAAVHNPGRFSRRASTIPRSTT